MFACTHENRGGSDLENLDILIYACSCRGRSCRFRKDIEFHYVQCRFVYGETV